MSTSCDTKRVIYFKGHANQKKSALITKVCKDYETLSAIYKGESATRTLWNLYNLHTVRGPLNSNGELISKSSMSGPHDYFGWIDPKLCYSLLPNDKGGLIYHKSDKKEKSDYKPDLLLSIGDENIHTVTNYEWIQGSIMDPEMRDLYSIKDELAQELVDAQGQRDSLFDDPGVLIFEEPELNIPLFQNPQHYNLSSFKAKIVPNDSKWSFDQELVSKYKHAQHKLRVISYSYGESYVPDYLMKGSGIFIERHEFIQAITPMNKECGGFVILGRETDNGLDLIACTIPFGHTLIVDVGSIHGDSTLIGKYQMAMTGNHKAMKTADSVFMKHRETRNNIKITTTPNHEPAYTPYELYLTSDMKSLEDLHEDNENLIQTINQSLGTITKVWWQPVIFTINIRDTFKTLGKSLPPTEDDVSSTSFRILS